MTGEEAQRELKDHLQKSQNNICQALLLVNKLRLAGSADTCKAYCAEAVAHIATAMSSSSLRPVCTEPGPSRKGNLYVVSGANVGKTLCITNVRDEYSWRCLLTTRSNEEHDQIGIVLELTPFGPLYRLCATRKDKVYNLAIHDWTHDDESHMRVMLHAWVSTVHILWGADGSFRIRQQAQFDGNESGNFSPISERCVGFWWGADEGSDTITLVARENQASVFRLI